jgi:hypothetical protein
VNGFCFRRLAVGLALLLTATPSWRVHVLSCLHAEGWIPVERRASSTILEARDGHAQLQLVFWRSAAAARRSIPDLAPVGVGWMRRLSYRSGPGFTVADEQAIYRCAR